MASAPNTRNSAPQLQQQPETTLLYFAFGSNLSSTQMRERCPGAVSIGLGFLSNWDFIINERGYANIIPASSSSPSPPSSPSPSRSSSRSPKTNSRGPSPRRPGGVSRGGEGLGRGRGVYGVLWQLGSEGEKRALDRHEGVPLAYEDAVMGVELLLPDRAGGRGAGLVVSALVYVDRGRVAPRAAPGDEYVARMNRAVDEARREWGLPDEYVEAVLRRFIPAPPPPLPPAGRDGGGGGGGGGNGSGGGNTSASAAAAAL